MYENEIKTSRGITMGVKLLEKGFEDLPGPGNYD